MKRVFVAADGSDSSQRALRWAAELAVASSADLIVATVLEQKIDKLPVSLADDARGGLKRKLAEEWCADLLARQIPHQLALVEGPHVGKTLLTRAQADGADLIAAGREGHGPWSLVGSVTNYLAHHTETPLLVVPPRAPEPGPEATVVVGVDGSAASRVAFDWTVETAKAMHMRVAAVHALNIPVEWIPRSDEKSWTAKATQELEDWADAAREHDVEVITRVPNDVHPVDGLNRAVENFGASLVVVGARGIGGFPSLRLGGVALQLMHHTKIATVIVPTAAHR